MTEKNEYSGNVGQVIMGNATGPSLHVSMGKHDEKTFITNLQRNRIAVKVKELIAASGRKQLDIYGDLLTEFGADNMDVFPRQKYKDACAYLDALIERSKHIAAIPPKACPGCAKAQTALHTAKLTNYSLGSVTLLLLAGLAWSMLWRSDANSATPSQSVCEHGQNRYTVGGIAENPDHTMMRCSMANGSVVWQPVEPPAKKVLRTPTPKRHVQQNDPD
ncbi:hypothetical protein [Undibacterium rugosum]|uniref:hypothetical protein n=1 Tax=Undibacterium rugosum TaxID=2762291 RepID=UPI001B8111B4|nr:hypothetical protein [Undibacterium rugosum]MBR7777386.1 hypothetical protein [Undibacterium rugosum]